MQERITRRHPIFLKYTRAWLNEVTGYTKAYLCRVATGNVPLSRRFTQRISLILNEPEGDLFSPGDVQQSRCLLPYGCSEGLGQWLEEKCRDERLSLREAATRIGVDHTAIGDIIKGRQPSAGTIRKIARGFGGDGADEGLALEDRLLVLAGYIREGPCQEEYLKVIPLLSPEHQHILEVLVRELAKIEGIEVPTRESGHSSGQSSKGEY